MRKAVTDK